MKRIIGILSIALLGGLLWLLFVKPHDFVAVMEAKTVPGTINNTLKTWSRSFDDSSVKQPSDMNHLLQELRFNDSVFVFDWRLIPENDSLTRLEAGVSLKGSSRWMRVVNLVSNTDFKRRARNTVLDFNEKLKEHLASFRVRIDGEAVLDPTYCAYVCLLYTSPSLRDGATSRMPSSA